MIELESVDVFRGDTDRKGNPSKAPVGSVRVAFAWSGTSRSMGRFGRQESAEASPTVFVPVGEDLRARDRIQRANGERYAVIGHGEWNETNQLSVFGYAWSVFNVEAMNG